MSPRHISVAVVGGSQAGLAASKHLSDRGVDHIVFERDHVGVNWIKERWDNFCLVTPNAQCALPGFAYGKEYPGDDPDGFMLRDEIVDYLKAFRDSFNPPLKEGCGVKRMTQTAAGGFLLEADDGDYTADHVVVATGGYQRAIIPPMAAKLPTDIKQLHSSTYRNAGQVDGGAALVVGTGQSGCQIAEDLHLAGVKVHLAVGNAPRAPRRYRGKDITEWLIDMGHYGMTVDEHPEGEAVRKKVNHYMTGRDGGRDIDLRQFANEGMALYGLLLDADGPRLRFADDLALNLDNADAAYMRIRGEVDKWIAAQGVDAPVEPPYAPVWSPPADQPTTLDLEAAGIKTIVWGIGFGLDYSWIDMPALDDQGYPAHHRGVSKRIDNLYFLGLPWMNTWGSGRFYAVGDDAGYLVETIDARLSALAA